MRDTPAYRQTAGVVLGDWVLDAPLGRGGFAEVWKAHHEKDGREAAVKVPFDGAYVERLKAEGKIQAAIDSPHVSRALATELAHDPPFLVLELVKGESLRQRLERGKLEELHALAVARAILKALKAAHAAGIVHRDLKPENVLVAEDGVIKVTDFGLGAAVDAEARTLLASGSLRTKDGHDLVGTVRYMSPEQRDPGRAIDARTDLYSWGVVLFEMLTGEPPSGSEVPSEVVPGLDPRVDRIFRRAYARLESRYASADEALEDVMALEAAPRAAAAETKRLLAARALAPRAGLLVRGVAFVLDLAPFAALGVEAGAPRGALLAFLAYDALCTAGMGGSIGKRLAGLRVARVDGMPLTLGAACARSALRALTVFPFLGAPALTALGREQRAVHDVATGSCVSWDVG